MRQGSGDSPLRGQVTELDLGRLIALVVGVQKNLRQIEESMVRIYLRAVGTGIVAEHFIFDASAVLRANDFPAAGIQLDNSQRTTVRVFSSGVKPVHVLREITHLIEGVPHRKLQLVSIATGGNFKRDPDEMALGISEGNDVANGCLRETELAD